MWSVNAREAGEASPRSFVGSASTDFVLVIKCFHILVKVRFNEMFETLVGMTSSDILFRSVKGGSNEFLQWRVRVGSDVFFPG